MYKITSKRLDRKTKKYIFTLQTLDEVCFDRFGIEIRDNKKLLFSLDKEDLFDVAYTLGSESVLSNLQKVKEQRQKPESSFTEILD